MAPQTRFQIGFGGGRMTRKRLWFSYIKKGLVKGYKKGHVIIHPKPSIYAEKGVERVMEIMNTKTGRVRKVAVVIGLGYADFEKHDVENKNYDKLSNVIKKKLKELNLLEEKG